MRVVSAFGAPPIDGLGTTGGFKLIIEDRGNLGLADLQRVSDAIVARGNKTAGPAGALQQLAGQHPLALPGYRPHQVHGPGRAGQRRLQHACRSTSGSYYVNNFNEFGRTWQVNVQADQNFRDTVATSASSRCRNNQGQMVRLGTLLDVRDTSGPVMVMRYNMYSAAAITGNAAPGTSSGQAIELHAGDRRQELPRVDGLRTGPNWPICNCRRATRPCSSSAWRWCSSSWSWPRSTKAGRCRWP